LTCWLLCFSPKTKLLSALQVVLYFRHWKLQKLKVKFTFFKTLKTIRVSFDSFKVKISFWVQLECHSIEHILENSTWTNKIKRNRLTLMHHLNNNKWNFIA
jgi:hypothetical protein